MNKRQKIVQQAFLNDEEKVINKLKNQYSHSLKEITKKAEKLQKDIERLDTLAKLSVDDEEKEKILSQRRSKVYQKQYQESLKKQVSDILDTMRESEFTTVSGYLNKCYEQGFLGTMYDLQGQGIPLCFPLDQEAMVRAVQLDSKISQGLYKRLGEDVSVLKRKIAAQISRGISTGMTFPQIAQQLAGVTNIGFNNAVRIARTEGHRIQCQSGMDACYKAREKGADVVKQWDSTLDGATRSSHVHVDGEIRELDEKFSNGLMFPSDPSGSAAEVINCRCALLQRAKWALTDEEFTKMDNESKELVKIEAANYDEFKKQYFEEVKKQAKSKHQRSISQADAEQFERYKAVLGENAPKTLEEFSKIKYNKKDDWGTLKQQYRVVNRYEVNGEVSTEKILQLDEAAFYGKKKGFDFSAFSGKEMRRIKNEISNCGNGASMEFEGKIYFSHSKFGLAGSFEHSLYQGEHPAVTLSKNRIFKVLDLGDGIPRQFDTEAKFLEFVASQKNPEDKFTVNILSEKHICKSCQGVVDQFKQMFPKSTVNIVSGKKGYNGDEEGLHTWKHRKKVK